ncbi:MAG: hypothetical protein WCO97_09120, partial [bacterium]
TAPFNDYEGLYGGYPNIKVVASYGGGGNPTTWSTAVSAATTALASANAALTTATNNQATKDAAVTTARGQRDTAQALFDTAATAYNDGQLEYFKALINLDTWTMRKNAEQITAAKARVDLDFERAFRWDSLIQTNYWDKMESLQNKEWLLRYAIQYAADNHLIVAVLTYQVARKTFELAIATANQTAAAIDGEQIILSVSDSGVWDAFATYQKGGTGLTKRKIKYKLRVEVEYSPRSTDNDLTFYWREATIVDKVPTFSDKTESVSIAESDPYAVLESHWHRLGWSSFYNIAAPSTNSDIKVVGLPIKSTLSLINQDSRGCIEQKLGFPEYTNQSTPPKVYMTETVAGTLSSDGSQFIYLTDYSEWYYDYSWAWNLIPITRSYNTYNSDKVEDEFRIPAKEITQTTRIYSDDSTLTLSDEFSTEYLKSLVDPVYNTPFGEWSDALDYIAYTGITITTDIQAYYIFPEDESVYGRRKYLFQLRGTLPASYGATDGGEDFDFTYSIFTRDLTTGVITEDEQDLTLTIINNSFATTGDGSEEEYAGYITIEATDRNTVKWIGKLMGGDNPRFWDKPICV